jgi:IS30 family transposase
MIGKRVKMIRENKHFTLEEKIKLEELLKIPLSIRKISKQMKRSMSGLLAEVRNFCKRSGTLTYNAIESHRLSKEVQAAKNPHHAEKKVSERYDEIHNLRMQGYSCRDISNSTGLSYSSVYRFVKKNKINPPLGIFPPNFEQRIDSLEMQMKILTSKIKELLHVKNN